MFWPTFSSDSSGSQSVEIAIKGTREYAQGGRGYIINLRSVS